MVKGLIDSHHKHKVSLNLKRVEDIGVLVVDIAGYSAVSVLMGILVFNIFGAAV